MIKPPKIKKVLTCDWYKMKPNRASNISTAIYRWRGNNICLLLECLLQIYCSCIYHVTNGGRIYFRLFNLYWVCVRVCLRVYMYIFINSLVFSPRGRSGRSQSPVMEPIWLLAHCILGKFLGVVCHCFPPPLGVPTFAATCLCVRSDARDPSSERWNCGRERYPVVILPKFRLPRKFLLHAVNLRHGTDGFASPPKEGVLRIFSP